MGDTPRKKRSVGILLGGFLVAVGGLVGNYLFNRTAPAVLDPVVDGPIADLVGINDMAWQQDWPLQWVDCGDANLGLPSSAPPPTEFSASSISEFRSAVLAAEAGPVGEGILRLRLSMPPGVVAQVTGIQLEVFSSTDDGPSWRYVDSAQCGGPVYARRFFADLESPNPSLVDLGVPRYGSDSGGSGEIRTVPLGEEFTVSEQDPATITVISMSCTKTVEWGLEIDYLVRGQAESLTIGSPEDPFINYGPQAPTFSPGIQSLGTFDGTLSAVEDPGTKCYSAADYG